MLRIVAFVAAAALALGGPATAADLSEIQARGTFIVATTGNFPPHSYINEQGELDGYDVALARLIAEKIGVKADIQKLDFSGILPGLSSNRFDAAMSNVFITPERVAAFDFSIPYSRVAVAAVVPTSSTGITGPTDLAGRSVGAITGAVDGEQAVQKIGGFANLQLYPGYAEMFSDLAAGRIEVAILGELAAGYYIKTHPDAGKIVGEAIDPRYAGVALQKDNTALREKIDEVIAELKTSGALDELALEYFGLTFELPDSL